MTINSDGSYTFNMAYYLLAQFSKFIPRDAIILRGTGSSASSNQPSIQSVATINPDGTRTVVVINTLTHDVYTSASLTGSGVKWSGNVPASSVVTWVLPAS